MRKIGGEHFVHSIPVFDLYQVDIRLKDAVHGSTANFHVFLHLVHDHAGVRFNRPFLGVSTIVGTLPRDINQSIVDNQRHNDVFLAARFAFAIQLADTTRILRCGTLSQCTTRQYGGSDSQSGEQGGNPSGKCSASES